MINNSTSHIQNLYSGSIPVNSEINTLNGSTGNGLTEVIVKFSGDIQAVVRELNAQVEILLKGYAIITINPDKIGLLYSYPQIESLELSKDFYIESKFNLTSSCIRQVQDVNTFGLTGKGVIVAIIDYGIDYLHQDFRNDDGTSRILYIWDQTISGVPPDGFAAGTEYSQAQINSAIRSAQPYSIVPSVDTSGHGTAVAGVAAGNGRESNGENKGVATQADLIIVKIGTRGFKSFARTTELMRGIKYVIDKARILNKPVVINMSFGINDGSHRGDSLFETYINDVSNEWKTSIVIPTGNEASAGHHFETKLVSDSNKEIEFFSAVGINQFYLSIWKNFSDTFSVELISPNGFSTGKIGITNQIQNFNTGNLSISVLYSQPSHYSIRQEIRFNIRSVSNSIASGIWKIIITTSSIVDGNIDVWLPTVEEVTANTRFSNPTEILTMTIPSTALKVIKVSGYNDRVGNIAEFSGVGSAAETEPRPDIAAPAVNILTTKNGGGYDTFTGTSIAAPFVTGSCALMMQWGIVNRNDPFLYGERIKAFLRLGANRKNDTIYPGPSFGYGTLCLGNSMRFLEQYKWGGNNQWLQT